MGFLNSLQNNVKLLVHTLVTRAQVPETDPMPGLDALCWPQVNGLATAISTQMQQVMDLI